MNHDQLVHFVNIVIGISMGASVAAIAMSGHARRHGYNVWLNALAFVLIGTAIAFAAVLFTVS